MHRITQNDKQQGNRGTFKPDNFDSDFRVLCKSVSVKANYHTRKITNSKTDNIEAVHKDKK